MIDHLAQVPLFSGCSQRDLQHLARVVDEVQLPHGTVLTHEGDVGREAFVFVHGTAEVTRDGVTVAEIGPGDVVGEMSLLDGGPRSATVTATSDIEALVLTRPAFDTVLAEVPAFAHRLLVSLAHRLRSVEESTHLH